MNVIDLITSRMPLRIVAATRGIGRSEGRRANGRPTVVYVERRLPSGERAMRDARDYPRSGGLRESADSSEGRRTCRRVTLAGRAQKRRFRRRTDAFLLFPLGEAGGGGGGARGEGPRGVYLYEPDG